MSIGVRTHCGDGAPQSQHLSFPAPSFFCIWESYNARLLVSNENFVQNVAGRTVSRDIS
jgi:hypothetical protein